MLITEALADLKTIVKRIEKKREFVRMYVTRPEGLRDPLITDGGSSQVIEREIQAIKDLENRIIQIRTGIQLTNLKTELTVEGVTKSIAEWLTWRKEVSDGVVRFVSQVRQSILLARAQAQKNGAAVVPQGGTPTQLTDLLINVDEGGLAKEAERLETILGTLDGQLSLKNATIQVEGL